MNLPNSTTNSLPKSKSNPCRNYALEPFQLFCYQTRNDLQASQPNLSASEITSILAKMWRDMDPRQRNSFINTAHNYNEILIKDKSLNEKINRPKVRQHDQQITSLNTDQSFSGRNDSFAGKNENPHHEYSNPFYQAGFNLYHVNHFGNDNSTTNSMNTDRLSQGMNHQFQSSHHSNVFFNKSNENGDVKNSMNDVSENSVFSSRRNTQNRNRLTLDLPFLTIVQRGETSADISKISREFYDELFRLDE
ncbi:hypothetical protein TRFO_33759 [Tritrichomonas foetus]|uniref:HMG box domain-containing protein n=1 Tax=Tritrichomonas foetus TaxID=1144522 RepID=A0A1J4JMU7_9EUKA|nr:hypothetical protein TRFO_33759 [Tritrichomonas foetus]|eukprot:OHS99759.1 hypothetical protein TRFO_33759 [Tritrichomonas foetus]